MNSHRGRTSRRLRGRRARRRGREGARRRATRERTVADRNGRDSPERRRRDLLGGGARGRTRHSNPNRSKSPLAATSTTPARGTGRDAEAARRPETARRAVASTDGTARAASPAAAPSASASASASRPVSWRAARARRRSTRARGAVGMVGEGERGRRGGSGGPAVTTLRAGASSGSSVVVAVGARVCPRAREPDERARRASLRARASAPERATGARRDARARREPREPARPPPRTCRRRAHCKPPLSTLPPRPARLEMRELPTNADAAVHGMHDCFSDCRIYRRGGVST